MLRDILVAPSTLAWLSPSGRNLWSVACATRLWFVAGQKCHAAKYSISRALPTARLIRIIVFASGRVPPGQQVFMARGSRAVYGIPTSVQWKSLAPQKYLDRVVARVRCVIPVAGNVFAKQNANILRARHGHENSQRFRLNPARWSSGCVHRISTW